ncbi:MAG: GspE/PulE family protein [Synergistaceae bacterium]|nr:GspE/PulE family protein [Synergistaceae bacterium]
MAVGATEYFDSLIDKAIEIGASDIHLEPHRLRFRVLGTLLEFPYLTEHHRNIINIIKNMAQLDTSESRLPQDGKFHVHATGRNIDIRVSTIPLGDDEFFARNEKAVLRLLDPKAFCLELDNLGFDTKQLEILRKAITCKSGMVILTGPTGSGKTTTLYSLLQILNKPDVNIVTVEDPVEYKIDGVSQIQVNDKIGLSFNNILPYILRQDPDIIMIGEIRDKETALAATQAALTGHLVLATLHTTNATTAIERLQNMGLPSYLISASVSLIVAQRLIRCDIKDGYFTKRVAVCEILQLDKNIIDLINSNTPESVLREQAITNGMTTMKQNALKLLQENKTTKEEISFLLDDAEC